MTDREIIIKGLEGVKEETGRHLSEGFAWMAEYIDRAIKELQKDPYGEPKAEFIFTMPDGYQKRYPVSPVSVTEDKANNVRIRTYGMSLIEYLEPVEISSLKEVEA